MRPRECPVCRKPIPVIDLDAPFRPFCSTRCKSADLGSWLDGRYRISRPVAEEDLNAGAPLAVEPAEEVEAPPTGRRRR